MEKVDTRMHYVDFNNPGWLRGDCTGIYFVSDENVSEDIGKSKYKRSDGYIDLCNEIYFALFKVSPFHWQEPDRILFYNYPYKNCYYIPSVLEDNKGFNIDEMIMEFIQKWKVYTQECTK
jgi:hypothetical protein